jgi:hypothetical protein
MGREGATIGFTIGLGIFGGWAFGALAAGAGWSATAAQIMTGLGYMGGSFLGSQIFANDSDVSMPKLANYPIQQASEGPPIVISYGGNRAAGVVVWMSDVTTYEADANASKGGGDENELTMYRRSFLISVCEGERNINRIWANNTEINSGVTYSYAGSSYEPSKLLGFHQSRQQEITVFSGDGENEGLFDLIGEGYSKYKHDCCVFFDNYDLGSSEALPNFTFEVLDTTTGQQSATGTPDSSTIIGNLESYWAGQSFYTGVPFTLTKIEFKAFWLPTSSGVDGRVRVYVKEVLDVNAGVFTLGPTLDGGSAHYEIDDLPFTYDEENGTILYVNFGSGVVLEAGKVYCFILNLDTDYASSEVMRISSFSNDVYDGGYSDPDWICELFSSDEGATFSGGSSDLWFAIYGRTYGTDANPSDMVLDLLTNRRYGAGMPLAYLDTDSFDTLRDYCTESGLLISIVISNEKPLLQWISYVLSHCGGFMYRQGNKLYVGAWRNEEPVGTITRGDLAVDDEGQEVPVQISQRKYSETFNDVRLEWSDRDNLYGTAITKAVDDVDIRRSGKRRKKSIELAGIKEPAVAEIMKWRLLIDSLYRFNTYAFRLGPKSQTLQCGKPYTLSDGFVANGVRVRITKIMESERANELEVEAIDDVSDLYPDLSGWSTVARNQRPDDVIITEDDLAEPTTAYREDWHSQVLHLSFAPKSVYTQGVLLFLSRDGNTYDYVDRTAFASITGGGSNVSGTLLSALPTAVAPTWRGDESFLVDVGTVGDLATDITDAQFFGNQKLAKIGSEIIAYKTCDETETPGQWRITGVIRGLFESNPTAHAIGETFATLNVDYVLPYEAPDIGQNLYIKAIPYYRNVGANMADIVGATIPVAGNAHRPFGAGVIRLTSDENDARAADQSYSGASFSLYWNLCAKLTGFNVGGQDGGGTWVYGDDEADLVSQGGPAYGDYQEDPELIGVDLVFREEDGTLISQRSLGVVSTDTIVKATDLGGHNPAEVEVWPRYALRATREESLTADDGS